MTNAFLTPNHAAALAHDRVAQAIAEKLDRLDPSNAEWRDDLAWIRQPAERVARKLGGA
jgi:hypothetical protein